MKRFLTCAAMAALLVALFLPQGCKQESHTFIFVGGARPGSVTQGRSHPKPEPDLGMSLGPISETKTATGESPAAATSEAAASTGETSTSTEEFGVSTGEGTVATGESTVSTGESTVATGESIEATGETPEVTAEYVYTRRVSGLYLVFALP